MNKLNPIRNNLVLELHVPNFAKAKEFYSKFGFQEKLYDKTSGGKSDLGYLVLERKDELGVTMINFYGDKEEVSNHSHFNQFSTSTTRGYGVEITIPVNDVERIWEEIKSKIPKSNISQNLKLKRWGKKDFRVIDPFGFYLRFTELVHWGQ